MKREEVKSIKELLGHFIHESGLAPGLNEARVALLWDELLGPAVASATLQKRLKEGKLYVRLRSSVVRNHLFTQRTNIVAKINQTMGKKVVSDIILY